MRLWRRICDHAGTPVIGFLVAFGWITEGWVGAAIFGAIYGPIWIWSLWKGH